MRNIRFYLFLLIGGACMLMCHSCSRCSRQPAAEDLTIDLADLVVDTTYVNMARKAYYALPTPVELSMLIKNSGMVWQPALLSDPADAVKYLTHQKIALNFGVYVTDLAYAGLFEQSQTALRYKRAIQQLAEELGLQSAVDLNTMQQLEANINDKDAALRIVSEMYATCMATLDENERHSLTLAILTGAWVEGMYILTGTIDEEQPSNESRMKQSVVDQKLTFDVLWLVMSEQKQVPEIANLLSDLSVLSYLYGLIAIDQTPNAVTDAADGKTSRIVSSNVSNVTPETYAKIKNQIKILRQNFTKK